MKTRLLFLSFAAVFVSCAAYGAAPKYSYRVFLDPADPAGAIGLFLQVNSQDSAAGRAVFGAGWKGTPAGPFVMEWGDGSSGTTGLPATHVYANAKRNYVATITGTFAGGVIAKASTVVRFTTPTLPERAFDPSLTVTLPETMPALVDTAFSVGRAASLTGTEAFSTFGFAYERSVIERVANAFAEIEHDLVNRNVYRHAGSFNQVGLHNTGFSGGASYWFTAPPSFGIGDSFISRTAIGWGTFAHEMGHNFTLNCPATYRSGGRTDGNGNAIFSECLSRVFEYTACHLLANNAAAYGVPDDVAADVFFSEASKLSGNLKIEAQKVISGQVPFAAWNDPATTEDETGPTFALLAWKFLQSTDLDGAQYRSATKRLMWFFEHWNPDWISRYDSTRNTAGGTLFRSTLMTAAISYATGKDLRAELRGWKFPIDDATWDELFATVGDYPGDDAPAGRLVNISTRARVAAGEQLLVSGFVITDGPKRVLIRAVGPGLATFGVDGPLPAPRLTLLSGTTVIATNSRWSTSSNADAIRQSSANVGAFALTEGSADAALLVDLSPGAYTAQISSGDTRDGVALVEVYEVSGAGHLSNISTRAQALTGGETLIPGFVITGVRPKNLLIRCAGPALAGFGLTGALARPSISLFRGATQVATNAGWASAYNGNELAAATRTAGAFAFGTNSADAALYVSLPPGSYTVTTAGADGRTGVALVEVYDLDAAP